MSAQLKAHIALFLVALIYGANYTVAKSVMDNEYIPPIGFVLLRVLSGTLFFAIIHYSFIREKIIRKDIGLLILCGLFGVAINQIFFFTGLKLTKPINASLIMTTCPIVVLIVSAIILKEQITLKKVIGILFGAVGAILLILYGEKVDFNRDRMWGDFLIFINATSYAIYLVLVKTLMKKYHPITVVKWVFAFGSIFVLPFGISGLSIVDWHTFSTGIWIAVAYVIVCTTFFTYLFNAFALKTVRASTVSIYIYLQPLLATFIALIFSSDKFVPEKMIFGAMIFLGVYLVSSKKAISKP